MNEEPILPIVEDNKNRCYIENKENIQIPFDLSSCPNFDQTKPLSYLSTLCAAMNSLNHFESDLCQTNPSILKEIVVIHASKLHYPRNEMGRRKIQDPTNDDRWQTKWSEQIYGNQWRRVAYRGRPGSRGRNRGAQTAAAVVEVEGGQRWGPAAAPAGGSRWQAGSSHGRPRRCRAAPCSCPPLRSSFRPFLPCPPFSPSPLPFVGFLRLTLLPTDVIKAYPSASFDDV